MSLLDNEKKATSLPAIKNDKINNMQIVIINTVVPAEVIAKINGECTFKAASPEW